MRKFISKTLLFIVLPIAIIFSICEYGIRQIPNEYSYKNSWLTENANTIEILNLGTSHTLYGINPVYFDKPAFNAAHTAQSCNYDNFIFNKFIGKMDSLKFVILPISYFTPFSKIERDFPKNVIKYRIYYDCPFYRFTPKYLFEIPNILSSSIIDFVTLLLKNKNLIQVNKLGFRDNYTLKNRDPYFDLKKNGPIRVEHHNSFSHYDLLKENKEYIIDIIEKCKSKNIAVILLTTPVVTTYYESMDIEQQRIKEELCESFVETYPNVVYFDMMQDSRFIDDDFYDGDHLNDLGSKKLTLILNDTIKKIDIRHSK